MSVSAEDAQQMETDELQLHIAAIEGQLAADAGHRGAAAAVMRDALF